MKEGSSELFQDIMLSLNKFPKILWITGNQFMFQTGHFPNIRAQCGHHDNHYRLSYECLVCSDFKSNP